MSDSPVLLAVYDVGSLAPLRLSQVARNNGCDVAFVVADTEHAQQMIPVLRRLGRVVNTAGRSEASVIDELRGFEPAGIITFSEFRIPDTVRLAAALGLPYHAPSLQEAVTNKDRQRERFAEVGLDTVRFRTVTALDQLDEAIARVGLPAIVKPVVGASSRNTTAVATADECRAVVAAALGGIGGPAETAVILEELLVGRPVDAPWGDYMAVDCVARGDDVRPVFVSSKFALAEPFRERGAYGGQSVVPDELVREVSDLACRAVGALGVHGVADVEIKLTPDGPRVIEVNGRLGAWVDDLGVRAGTGVPADIAVKAALGRPYTTADPVGRGPAVFHYLIVPPMGACRVKSVRDLSGLRQLPYVERVVLLAEPGANVDWRIGAAGNVAAVSGAAPDPAALAETVAAIEATDWIDYE
ncbi:acetyl-CoA carboxylase biotin carboxylase subunit family protein [Streptomyces sp. NRRL S-31]|uniref:ATP-grasp domain-containing protein n=1 Tax=Streptomyces sp. NRRL S-31 TaxID=1463898 RepID=UPI00069AD825|nr:ATP-grasp domain-containing protein [Streptomyces sp. NRRL S-31]